MTQDWHCDNCDDRITRGYTVCWSEKLTDSPAGVHFSQGAKLKNLCGDCFPKESKSLFTRITEMVL